VSRGAFGSSTNLAQTYRFQTTSPGTSTAEIILDYPTPITTVCRKQTPPLQDDPETYLDVRDTAMGNGVNLQHRNPWKISSQSTPDHHWRTMVHPKCNNTPRPTSPYRQTHCEDLQSHLPLSAGKASQQTDTTTDPRALLPSVAQAKTPARPANYNLVELQRIPVVTTSLQWHKDIDWV
jgi:hypothetical protein